MMIGNQQTSEYIKSALATGKSREDIYKELLGQGISISDIEAAFVAPTAEIKKTDSHQKVIKIIVGIAALMVSAGIFSLVASNWEHMTDAVKIIIIVVFMVFSYGVGWYLREVKGLTKTGGAFVFLGSLIYGAGIFLVAQIFNIRANWPDGFILWMLGSMVMAYGAEMFSLLYLSALLGIVSVFGHPIGIFVGGGFRYDPFLLTSPLLLLIATVTILITGITVRKKMPPEFKDFY